MEINYFELSDNVKGIYMKPKGHIPQGSDSDTDDNDFFNKYICLYI